MRLNRLEDCPEQWVKAKPSSVGWYLTCRSKEKANSKEWKWRWFDGKIWSIPVDKKDDLIYVCIASQIRSLECVFWCNYWPENARVPRL